MNDTTDHPLWKEPSEPDHVCPRCGWKVYESDTVWGVCTDCLTAEEIEDFADMGVPQTEAEELIYHNGIERFKEHYKLQNQEP